MLSGLTQRRAETDPRSPNPQLRGRTYSIPFEAVWAASNRIAGGGQRGWRVVSADDEAGVLIAERTSILRAIDDVRIDIGLDPNGQTRVDASSEARSGRFDLGRNRRSIGRFLSRLDAELKAGPGQILDPTLSPDWTP